MSRGAAWLLTSERRAAILTYQAAKLLRITIDDRLMDRAMRSSYAPTMRAIVEEALRLLIQTRGQASIRRLRGKVNWNADLDSSRSG